METQSFRGKGFSKTKFTKDGRPKRAGNWSAISVKIATVQSKDYKVRNMNGQIIVGTHTLLRDVMGMVAEVVKNDPYFEKYEQNGYKKVNGKLYEMHLVLTKKHVTIAYARMDYQYILRVMIYTMGEVDFEFPDY